MNEFPLVEVAGSAYEMGFQHGAQVAGLIDSYIGWIEKNTDQPRQALAEKAIAFEPYIQQLNPLLLTEVHGLAAGANISYGEALLCQVRGSAANIDGCTAFALTREATSNGQPLAGQNQDLGPEFSDFGIVLRVQPNDGRPQAITFTFAGQLGYMGMNEHGVSHFANGLSDCRWHLALPHYPLKRTLFEQRTVEECIAILAEHRLCSAGNMVFCDGNGDIADVEIRPEGISIYHDDHPDRRLHTNHYITEEFAPHETHGFPDSTPRLQRLRELVLALWGQLDVDAMKEILSDHNGNPGAICRHGAKGSYSIAGYIADPANKLFHVRRGFGCTGSWKAYRI